MLGKYSANSIPYFRFPQKPEAIGLLGCGAEEHAQGMTRLLLAGLLVISETNLILQVCITNTISLRGLLANPGKVSDPKTKATFDFSVHKYYPIIDIK